MALGKLLASLDGPAGGQLQKETLAESWLIQLVTS